MTQTVKTLAFIGCGNMGGALLHGFLEAMFPEDPDKCINQKVSRFIACTTSEKSARTLEENLGRHAPHVRVLYQQNQAAMEQADVIILGFKPAMATKILQEPGVRQSVSGKLVISLLAGLSTQEIQSLIEEPDEPLDLPSFHVSKAIPNLAARYGKSMTIVEQPLPDFPRHYIEFLEWMFGLVGCTKFLDHSLVDVGSVLVTTCLATLTIPLDGLLDGSVVKGFRRTDAMDLVVQGVVGLGALLSHGSHPAILREQISSPKGCTIQTLVSVERQGGRAMFTDALLQGTEHLESVKERK
ncbi:hypothetical protein ACJZ2D_008235 [Fusarium nematophilum]